MSSDLVPGTVLEPETDEDGWRFVAQDGRAYRYGEKQVALVTHLASHAVSTAEAARAVGMDTTAAHHALVKPHVKALMARLTTTARVQLGSASVRVLLEAITDSQTPARERAELALKVLNALGEGESRGGGDDATRGQGGGRGAVHVNVTLPHAGTNAGGGVTVDEPR